MKKRLNISQAWYYGWHAMRENFFFVLIAQIIIYGVTAIGFGILWYLLLSDSLYDEKLLIAQVQANPSQLLNVFVWLIFTVFLGLWALLNWTTLILKIRDGKRVQYSDIKLLPPRIMQFFAMGVLLFSLLIMSVVSFIMLAANFLKNDLILGLSMFVGFAFIIYVALRMIFITYYFVDSNLGIVATIKKAFALTKGSLPRLMLFFLLFSGVIGIPVGVLKGITTEYCKLLETAEKILTCFGRIEFLQSFVSWIVGVLGGFMYVDLYRQLKPRRG